MNDDDGVRLDPWLNASQEMGGYYFCGGAGRSSQRGLLDISRSNAGQVLVICPP